MPVADYATYCRMLDRARTRKFAYPAINVTSLTAANAVLRGLAESRSDGIIQVSTGGGAFASGTAVKDMALGAISIAEHVHRVADRYPIYVALHTDHCQADKLDAFVMPLVEETERRRAAGRPNLFNSHMFDGSALPLKDNLDIAVKLRERFRKSDLVLEVEVGVVGGEEDGVRASAAAKLYTTPEDALEVARRLNPNGGPLNLVAATFGNVHGVYKPGHVKLKPSILKECQEAVVKEFGPASRFYFVFHGGSGSDRARHPRGIGLRRGEDERRHRTCSTPSRAPSPIIVSNTTTACSGSTATSATRRRTTRAPTSHGPSRRWRIG
jgi:fructose-bisphosphate aldolase class II